VGLELERHTEPLETEELAFLEKKEAKGKKMYYRVYQILMVFSFVVPYVAAWYRVADGAPNAFSYAKFFVSAGILLVISSISVYVPYRYDIKKVQLDIVHKTKTIEKSHVTRKVYFPSQNTYFFYIDSKTKMSIEVSGEDFNRMKEGDEVCIEYTTHSKEYLGYF
jgi:hypothetical protein